MQNIIKTTKAIALLTLLMFMFFSKGIYEIPLKSTNTKHCTEKKEQKKNENHVAINLDFEATISIFNLEFHDFSQFVSTTFVQSLKMNKNFETQFSVSIIEYFRILFSKITPINAP